MNLREFLKLFEPELKKIGKIVDWNEVEFFEKRFPYMSSNFIRSETEREGQ